ncbi:MAG: stage III sporulation protein AF [Firmicutes bacterium]|nr:stage III sporulation protein AF [Dethiobacter sp.]MBS3889298.1 stage III sporulation protein AF [Bacillota bacterium]MBS4053158.1 stage III sporulation protein AF [Thermaerobacter sp.]
MMEFLRLWVQDIVVLLVLALVVDMALPSGPQKRYVDYALGLMLLLLLLNPVKHILDNELNVAAMLAQAEAESDRRLMVHEPLSAQSTWLTYRMILEDRISELAAEHKEVITAQAEVSLEQAEGSANFGRPTAILLTIQVHASVLPGGAEEAHLNSDIKERLAEVYGIEQAHIAIEFTR